jgi:hypothetical protein
LVLLTKNVLKAAPAKPGALFLKMLKRSESLSQKNGAAASFLEKKNSCRLRKKAGGAASAKIGSRSLKP